MDKRDVLEVIANNLDYSKGLKTMQLENGVLAIHSEHKEVWYITAYKMKRPNVRPEPLELDIPAPSSLSDDDIRF